MCVCVSHMFLTYSFIEGHLQGFHVLAKMNNAAMNIAQFSLQDDDFVYLNI